MSDDLRKLPELRALDRSRNLIRIPPEVDVPVTERVLRLIEAPSFRRLQHVSQLGLVAHVYPGATHSRFQHSLGVYRMALMYLKSLGNDEQFRAIVSEEDAKRFVVSALLHDIGHFPFCHLIEDLHIAQVPRHEELARCLLEKSDLSDLLHSDWGLTSDEIANFLAPDATSRRTILHRMLSGPIDVDKLDYLDRDSLHAGVPYGRNFDRQRLIQSLCLGPHNDRLAVTEKGRTAAEMMVFARYVMFSEVYWHHAVRSATAMLQRAVSSIDDLAAEIPFWIESTEASMMQSLLAKLEGTEAFGLVDGLFGMRRRLYKRLAEFHSHRDPELHAALARRPYSYLVERTIQMAEALSSKIGEVVRPTDLLIDAPPLNLEVQRDMDVRQRDGRFLTLAEVSPVVRALAEKQFDDVVKKVRIFIRPELRDRAREVDIRSIMVQCFEG